MIFVGPVSAMGRIEPLRLDPFAASIANPYLAEPWRPSTKCAVCGERLRPNGEGALQTCGEVCEQKLGKRQLQVLSERAEGIVAEA